MKGSRGASLRFTLIPKTILLHQGERVITNGLQDGIPANLYIGDITSLEESENSIFNTALVKPPYTIENLSVVAIVK
jgi:rod shape-determining protein MreC